MLRPQAHRPPDVALQSSNLVRTNAHYLGQFPIPKLFALNALLQLLHRPIDRKGCGILARRKLCTNPAGSVALIRLDLPVVSTRLGGDGCAGERWSEL